MNIAGCRPDMGPPSREQSYPSVFHLGRGGSRVFRASEKLLELIHPVFLPNGVIGSHLKRYRLVQSVQTPGPRTCQVAKALTQEAQNPRCSPSMTPPGICHGSGEEAAFTPIASSPVAPSAQGGQAVLTCHLRSHRVHLPLRLVIPIHLMERVTPPARDVLP